VREQLDILDIYATYSDDERGRPPYNPTMMVALLLWLRRHRQTEAR